MRRRNLPPYVFVAADQFRDQLRQVADTVELGAGLLRRCLECNQPLETLGREVARERVPAFVFETQPAFWGCPRCHRLYWAATHREHIVRELEALGLAAAVAA